MKLLIDTKTDKLCFAEAGSDVVDFLSGLLSLPLGTVSSLLTKERMAGSVVNVLGSMEELDINYKSKEGCLSPAVVPATLSSLQELLGSHLSNVSNNMSLYTCDGPNDSNYSTTGYYKPRVCGYVTDNLSTACPSCKKPMYKSMEVAPEAGTNVPKVDAVAPMTYAVKDDLSVTRASNVMSGITLLAQCGVKDFSTLQEKTVRIGKEEVWWWSLVSSNL